MADLSNPDPGGQLTGASPSLLHILINNTSLPAQHLNTCQKTCYVPGEEWMFCPCIRSSPPAVEPPVFGRQIHVKEEESCSSLLRAVANQLRAALRSYKSHEHLRYQHSNSSGEKGANQNGITCKHLYPNIYRPTIFSKHFMGIFFIVYALQFTSDFKVLCRILLIPKSFFGCYLSPKNL